MWDALLLGWALTVPSPTVSGVAVQGPGPGVPMTFGLSERQRAALYELTEGAVDLRHYRLLPAGSRAVGGEPLSDGVPPPGFFGTPDPDLDSEWWHRALEAPKAWTYATGRGVTVADCDSGFYTSEPDIGSNLLLGDRYDLSDKDSPLQVDDGGFTFHGTSVVAILAGVLDGKGTNGLAFDARVVPLQNYNYDHTDDLPKEEATAACVLRAIAHRDVDVIVLENQTPGGSSETFSATRAAVRLAIRAGLTVVSAAGNYSVEIQEELKDDTGSILVGALERNGSAASFTNYGKRITVAAYGRDLRTLAGPDGKFDSFGGTSGATPQVAALVALMLEVNPRLSPAQVRGILEQTRKQTKDNEKVGGIVDFPTALGLARRTPGDQYSQENAVRLRGQVRAILETP